MVIGLVNAGVMTLMQATPIIMGANIGTTITGVLVALKNDYFNMLMYLFAFAGVMMGFFKNERIKIAGLLCSGLGLIFTAIVWIFREPMINLLVSLFPGNDPMSLQMRVSVFHVIFNVTTTVVLLPFVKQLVQYSCTVIRDRQKEAREHALKFVDERLLSMPSVALMQAKKEIDYMLSLVEENIRFPLFP